MPVVPLGPDRLTFGQVWIWPPIDWPSSDPMAWKQSCIQVHLAVWRASLAYTANTVMLVLLGDVWKEKQPGKAGLFLCQRKRSTDNSVTDWGIWESVSLLCLILLKCCCYHCNFKNRLLPDTTHYLITCFVIDWGEFDIGHIFCVFFFYKQIFTDISKTLKSLCHSARPDPVIFLQHLATPQPPSLLHFSCIP